jgi:hypothetical protein
LRVIVHDRWGNPIYLTDERWEHILEFHEEMVDFRDELFTTLKQGRRIQEPLDPFVYTYFHPFDYLPGDNTHIIAIVKFTSQSTRGKEVPNNFVLTAYHKTLYSQR